ncbi:hypothetical protein [Gordonia sp. OPL2]|uniref:hypothetical protein n=1 Tax=Gordonia sp. OPL2 TaxID=2486274 RepID=UPI0021CCE6D5|nr:hypothetical protein [Gordonia sp. OPL2]
MLTRALAAEIRQRPEGFLALLAKRSDRVELSSASVDHVECESVAKVDVLVRLAGGATIGIEAKLDHELTSIQVEKLKAAVDDLFLLVLEPIDAEDYLDQVSGVVTWTEAISSFRESRIWTADIESLPPQKVAVERVFRKLTPSLREELGAGWDVRVGRGGSGMSAITIWSPQLADHRQLRGQIQVSGRAMPAFKDDLQFEFHVGVETRDSLADFPVAQDTDTAPGWVHHLQTLRDRVIGDDLGRYKIRATPCRNGRSGVGKNKLGLVAKFLPETPWIAQGYFDWSLGPKSRPVDSARLPDLADSAATLFREWYSASTASVPDSP